MELNCNQMSQCNECLNATSACMFADAVCHTLT